MTSTSFFRNDRLDLLRSALWVWLLIGVPLMLGAYVTGFYGWDLSVPIVYSDADDIWQMTLSKVLYDTGWILTNPYLGAPEVANWHFNAAVQSSVLHSVLMLLLSNFVIVSVKYL